MNKRTRNVAGAVGVGAAIGLGILIHGLTTGGVLCAPDPAAQIAALPAGATFQGTGCYITHGIVVTAAQAGLTINGGKYEDPDNSVPPQTTHGAIPLPPIIKVIGTHDVTIENVHLVGANTNGTFHSTLVNNAGIDVLDSNRITLTNVRTTDTFGDGLELWTANPSTGHADGHITVTNYTAVNAGRDGFSLLWVNNVTMTNVHGKSYSFETDTGQTVAPGNVAISDCSVQTLINIPNAISGPITFDHCTGSAQITMSSAAANGTIPASPIGNQPVTISNSQIATPANSNGYPPSGLYDSSGVLFLTGDTFTRIPNVQTTGPAYYALNGAHLTINATTFTGPPGKHDGTSVVTTTP